MRCVVLLVMSSLVVRKLSALAAFAWVVMVRSKLIDLPVMAQVPTDLHVLESRQYGWLAVLQDDRFACVTLGPRAATGHRRADDDMAMQR
jgi:hypothetical protein